MKGLTLTQPWASLVAIGAKKIETRSWKAPYRGWLAIHAAKGFPREAKELCSMEPFVSPLQRAGLSYIIPVGAIVAVCNLHHVGEIAINRDAQFYIIGKDRIVQGDEVEFGDYRPGRYGWILTNVQRLPDPIPCKGALSLWDVPADVLAEMNRQLPGRGWT